MGARRRTKRDYFVTVAADGLLTYEVGPWAEDKYRYLGMYAEMFATGMKNLWDRRVYLDLFCGPGYAKVRGSKRIVMGSPLIALSLPDPFDAYIFADENEEALSALKARIERLERRPEVSYLSGDANTVAGKATDLARLGSGGRTLSFCFLDPYKLNIHFETVQRLATGRPIDFLILLALYVDANRNVRTYVREIDLTIDRFLGDSTWRERWTRAEQDGDSIVKFLAMEYASRMTQIGYLPTSLEEMVKIRTRDKRLPLYYLAFFSRNKKGLDFWSEVRKYSIDQLALEL